MSENKKLNEQIAQDFYNNFKGKLEDEQLDQVVQEIKCTENKYHTQGSLICAVFYFRVTVGGYGDVKKQFTGNGGGGGLPGAQALIGDLYTSDLERLYRDTDSFQFTVTPVYTSVLFFDKSSRLLGHYQAGAVSTPTGGIGGGKRGWEKMKKKEIKNMKKRIFTALICLWLLVGVVAGMGKTGFSARR